MTNTACPAILLLLDACYASPLPVLSPVFQQACSRQWLGGFREANVMRFPLSPTSRSPFADQTLSLLRAGIMFTYSPRQVISTLKVQLPVLNRHLVLTSRPTISIFTYTPNVCLQGMKAPDPCEEHGCMAFCIGACGIRCLLPTPPWPDSSLNWA